MQNLLPLLWNMLPQISVSCKNQKGGGIANILPTYSMLSLQTPSQSYDSVDDLVNIFNSEMTQIINKIAPIKCKKKKKKSLTDRQRHGN